jgi:soluble lytic murein transglycosylase
MSEGRTSKRQPDLAARLAMRAVRPALQLSYALVFGLCGLQAASARPGVAVADLTTPSPLPAPSVAPGATQADGVVLARVRQASADARLRTLGYDATGFLAALAAYRSGHSELGDATAAQIFDPIVRTALAWMAVETTPAAAGADRLRWFVRTHENWPLGPAFQRDMEARLFYCPDPVRVELYFTDHAPQTIAGKLALARALRMTGRESDATMLARAVFRESDPPPFLAAWLMSNFAANLPRGDYKYRADRLLYQAHVGTALREAARAGADVFALAKARAALIAKAGSDKAVAAVPDAWRQDPGLVLAEAQKLRRENKLIAAAQLLQSLPHDARLIDGDAWWEERRALARELLDHNKPKAAYITCALHGPASREAEIEAEFHAGWIALRFLHDPTRATYHFWVAAKKAETPNSIARIAYWQARTADAADDPAVQARAHFYYEKAAQYGATYYGQLARETLGLTDDLVHDPGEAAVGDARFEAIRVIEVLFAAGERDTATNLAMEAAQTLTDPRQIGALAAVIADQQDAHLALLVGKLFGQRGIAVDPLAFPTFGIPPYRELANSAPIPIVYSVARQESAFKPVAVSKAGAKGLMQMILSTARHTAVKAGVRFDAKRLLHDAAFNAQLGAAHLGALMAEHKGSLILTFAAYNAGGGRVQEWIAAYGDPRKPGIDPIDWVERIPFAETRNYVQHVMANVVMYNALFATRAKVNASAKAPREAKL